MTFGHTWWCLGTASGSVLRDWCWQCWGGGICAVLRVEFGPPVYNECAC